MKHTLFLAAICASLFAHATDWDLFPLKQRSYFMDNYTGQQLVDVYLMDSMRPNGSDTALYFRKALNAQTFGACHDLLVGQIGWWPNAHFYTVDSLVQHGDTIRFGSPLSSTPFFFLPQASVGQGWTITSTYSGNTYDQITITCASVEMASFLGVEDSVKIFTMSANGSTSGQTPISAFTMRLSKHYGLLEFVPFISFLYHPAGFAFHSVELIGFDGAGVQRGYKQPTFSDYFHLHAGDVLRWQVENHPDQITTPWTTEYLRDTITSSIITEDSVIYTFDRTWQHVDGSITVHPGWNRKFHRSILGQLLIAPPSGLAIGGNEQGWNDLLHSTGLLSLSLDQNGLDTITSYRLAADGSADTTSCVYDQLVDMAFSSTYDTRAGSIEECIYGFGSYCTTLIAYRINGEQQGNIALSTNDLSLGKEGLAVYPDPATDIVYFSGLLPGTSTCEVFDALGHALRRSEPVVNNGLDVSGLGSGLYVIRVRTSNGIFSARFAKN